MEDAPAAVAANAVVMRAALAILATAVTTASVPLVPKPVAAVMVANAVILAAAVTIANVVRLST